MLPLVSPAHLHYCFPVCRCRPSVVVAPSVVSAVTPRTAARSAVASGWSGGMLSEEESIACLVDVGWGEVVQAGSAVAAVPPGCIGTAAGATTDAGAPSGGSNGGGGEGNSGRRRRACTAKFSSLSEVAMAQDVAGETKGKRRRPPPRERKASVASRKVASRKAVTSTMDEDAAAFDELMFCPKCLDPFVDFELMQTHIISAHLTTEF